MTTELAEARKRSVTAEDQGEVRQTSGVVTVLMGPAGLLSTLPGLQGATGLPGYWTPSRDRVLRATPQMANLWASAIFKAITKQTALGFKVEDATDSERRVKAAQALMHGFDGAYVTGMARLLRDFLTTDNGGFVEVVWRGARPAGLFHLNSLWCTRTGDDDWPVVYTDSRGRQHALKAHQVLCLSDMPDPDPMWYGVGFSAASRAFETILKVAAIETYFREKVSGARNLAIHIVNGITDVQLREALLKTDASMDARGYVHYKGSTIIPMVKQEAPSVVTIPLAEIPDGFNARDEREEAKLGLALAIGLDPQELGFQQPAGLNSGMSTVALQEAAEQGGMAAFRSLFQHLITFGVLPGSTTFTMVTNDMRDKELRWKAEATRIGSIVQLVEKGGLPASAGLNILADDGIIPPELVDDQTSAGVVTDNEKVVSPDQLPAAQVTPEEVDAQAEQTATKAADLAGLLEGTYADAVAWARLALAQEE
jgi:hypothetical protein